MRRFGLQPFLWRVAEYSEGLGREIAAPFISQVGVFSPLFKSMGWLLFTRSLLCAAVTSMQLATCVCVARQVKGEAASILPVTTAPRKAFILQSRVENETWQRAQMSEWLNARGIREPVSGVSPPISSSVANHPNHSSPWRTAAPFFPPSLPHARRGQMWSWICLRWLGYSQRLKKAWSVGS